jgi:BASS family bile acid:Na+ symporter
MTATVLHKAALRERVPKHVCNACAILGFLVALLGSRYVGMSMSAKPAITAATAILWVAAFVSGYLAFVRGRKAPPPGTRFWLKLSAFVNAYSSLVLTLAILTGYLFYPTIEAYHMVRINPYYLMFIVFIMGMAIDREDWKRIVRYPRIVSLSALFRWALMPVSAYAVGHLTFVSLLPGETGKMFAVGLILLATSPTGAGSNALTMIAKGDLALSVSVTTVNTLLAAVLLPFIMRVLAGGMVAVHAGALFEDLIRMVIIPVALGSVIRLLFTKQCERMKPVFAPVAVVCVGLLMMGTMANGAATLLRQMYVLLYLVPVCIIFATLAYVIGFFVPLLFGFSLKQRIAACFEVGFDNVALTITLAGRHFGPLAMLVAIVYGKAMVIIGTVVFVPLFERMAEKKAAEDANSMPSVEKSAGA